MTKKPTTAWVTGLAMAKYFFLFVFLLLGGTLPLVSQSPSSEPSLGVAWVGESSMPRRVLDGMLKVLETQEPGINVESHPALDSLEELERIIQEFESSKKAMVILRSNGAQYLGQRGVAIPAFIGAANDRVALGAVQSYTETTGNITGVTYHIPGIVALETFLQILPSMEHILLLVEKDHPGSVVDVEETRLAAHRLGLELRVVYGETVEELTQAIKDAEPEEVILLGIQALIMDNTAALMENNTDRIFFSLSERAVELGALAGLTADDEKLGMILGEMVLSHLMDGVPIDRLPIRFDPEPDIRINYTTLELYRPRISFTFYRLAKTQQFLTTILETAPSGIGMVENRVITEVNDYILRLTGYSREELIGQSARMLYPTQEDSDYVGQEKYRQIALYGTGTVETRWQQKDGTIRYVILSSTPLDPSDLSIGVTFTVQDITESKLAEEALATRTRLYFIGLGFFILVLLILLYTTFRNYQFQKKIQTSLVESEQK